VARWAPARRVASILRWLATHPSASAGVVLGGFVLIYLWPVLVGGKILSPLAILYGFFPWKHYVPGDARSYFNPLLFDVPTADYPWRWLIRELLREGTFPAWNPHVFAGAPLYANPQTGLFSPFSVPLWLLPLNYGIGVGAALKLWAGGFGTYLLERELRMSFLPGLLAGVSFSFSALNIVWLTHETLPAVAVMLPWIAWLVERIYRGGRWGCVVGLAAVTAIGLGGGHPGMQVHLLVVGGMLVLLRGAFLTDVPWRERARAFASAYGGLVLGVLLMASMLIPEALSSEGTIGTIARSHGGTLPGAHMPFAAIRTTVFPDWWGRPSAFEVDPYVVQVANYNERTFYAGAVALLLAMAALLNRGAWRRKAPYVAIGVVGLAIPLHAPGLYWLATHLPVLDEVQSQRLHFAFAFAVAVLAAFGLQALLDRPRGRRASAIVPLAALVLAGAAASRAGAQPGDLGRVVHHFLTGADYASASVVALTSVAWFALLALGIGLAVGAAWRWPERRRAIAALVVLLAMVDAYHFAHGYQPMARPTGAVPPVTPAISYLQRHAHGGRLVGLGGALMNDWSLTYGLDDIRGYDPPQPTLRFFHVWQLANASQTPWQPFSIDQLGAEAQRVVSLLGARYVVAPPEVTWLPDDDTAALRPLRPVYYGEDATIFRNPNAAPRATVPAVLLAADEQATLNALAAPGFEPRRHVVVERDQPGAAALRAGGGSHGHVAIVGDRNARVTLRATLDRTGLVVLNDAWAPGWTVRVDGRRAVPLRVDDVMRGVVVGAGRHEVVWSYAVPGLRIGLVLSLLAVALTIAALGARARTARRRTARR
jgi:hypothetical protein